MNTPRRITIESAGLTVQYGSSVALRDLSFSVTGNVISVIGRNGSGKSTLMKTLLQLLDPRAGTLSAREGERILSPEEEMSFCPEQGAVFQDIPVRSYLELWCRLRWGRSHHYLSENRKVVQRLHIEHLLPKLGRALSKGERRRVQIAISLLIKPALVIFDEPFDGLDIEQTEHLVSIIEEEANSSAFLISSHRMDVVERVSDTIVVLDRGKIVTYGECGTVKAHLDPNGMGGSLTEAMSQYLRVC